MPRRRSRRVQLELQDACVTAEVLVRGVDWRAVGRRDRADQEVDGASGDSLGAAAIEELRGPFIVVGRDWQVGKRAQADAEALPGPIVANARQEFLATGADQVGVPG